MRLVDVYLVENADILLYELLAERPHEHWISHERMPTFREHQAFIASHPFRYWLLVMSDMTYVGAIEVTDRNEVGIAILKRYQKRGLGSEALHKFIEDYQPLPAIPALRNGRWLANIAVGNESSEIFFRKMGFITIQKTMVLRHD